jgi:hypothetical protein
MYAIERSTPKLVAGASTRRRTLHLIDIENLVGAKLPGQGEASQVRTQYWKQVGVGETDHIVIACSHLAFRDAAFGWRDARHLVRSGRNGADLALLDVIYRENVSCRFTHIAIGSGDGIFTPAAAYLARHGCHVTAVSRRGHLSAALRLAVHDVVYLESESPEAPLSAAQVA